MSFSLSIMNQNVIFLDAVFFQDLTCRKSFISTSNAFFSKPDVLYFFEFKNWHAVKFFFLKCDMSKSFSSKSNPVYFLFQNLTSSKILE